jgi:response regulator RpfG family c-di-GMP phosphodiesterase
MRATEQAFHYTMEALARAAEVHDDATGTHLQRVNAFSGFLAQAMGCDRAFVRSVGATAMMHDVGKIHIHPEILAKPGPLNHGEMETMKKHPLFGARILGDSPRLADAREIALCHHERWDGAGYPRRLRGEEIPMAARIVAISDVYDALRSPRPYKMALSHEAAIRIIRVGDERGQFGAFDPRCLETFLDVANHIDGLFLRFQEGLPPKPA